MSGVLNLRATYRATKPMPELAPPISPATHLKYVHVCMLCRSTRGTNLMIFLRCCGIPRPVSTKFLANKKQTKIERTKAKDKNKEHTTKSHKQRKMKQKTKNKKTTRVPSE